MQTDLVIVIHVLEVVLFTDEQVEVFLPVRMHGIHVCLKTRQVLEYDPSHLI